MSKTDNSDYIDSSLKRIAKGAGIYFVGSVIGILLGYLSRIIIARLLDASSYGIICLGFTIMSIAHTLALVGMYGGVQRFVSFYMSKGDLNRVKGTIFSAFIMCSLTSLVALILIIIYADHISIGLFHERSLTPVLKAFSIAIPFMVFTSLSISITLGLSRC